MLFLRDATDKYYSKNFLSIVIYIKVYHFKAYYAFSLSENSVLTSSASSSFFARGCPPKLNFG